MRNLTDPKVMHDYVTKPIEKIMRQRDKVVEVDADYSEGDVVLVSYGTVARSAMAAARLARAEGLKVGTLTLKTIWPFAGQEVARAAQAAKSVLVLENNTGQMLPYIKAEAAAHCPVSFLGPKILGQVHEPAFVLQYIKEVLS